MTKAQLIAQLIKGVKQSGSETKAAANLGCSQQYLHDILIGRREPGTGFLANLGLEKVITFRKTEAL